MAASLLKTNFPQTPATERGVLQKFYRIPEGVWGDVRYVHHGGVGTAGPGWTPETAFTTINSALAACANDNNDLVVVLPGHAETIASASAIDFTKTGTTVLGVGFGTNRPTVTFGTATTASIDFSVANCTLKNIRCVSNVDNLVSFVIGGAGNATIENCEFVSASTKEAICHIIVPTTFDNWTIRGCNFVSPTDPANTDGDANTGAIYLEDSEDVLIENCTFRGNFESALIHNKTTGALNLWIVRCRGIQNLSGAEPVLLSSTAVTGAMVECYFITPAETQVTEATLSGTFQAGFFNGESYFGNDGGGGQLMVASQVAAS